MFNRRVYDTFGFRVRPDDDVPSFRLGPDGEPLRNSLPITSDEAPGFRVKQEKPGWP